MLQDDYDGYEEVKRALAGTGIMLTTAEYRDGVVTDFQPEKYNQPSPYGGIMIAVCLLGGGGMFAFEFSTFSRDSAYVMPWLWTARTALYTGLALPGFFTAVNSHLMPPLLGSIFCVFAAVLNAVSMMAELPSAKAWKAWYHPFWAGGGKKNEQKNNTERGTSNSLVRVSGTRHLVLVPKLKLDSKLLLVNTKLEHDSKLPVINPRSK